MLYYIYSTCITIETLENLSNNIAKDNKNSGSLKQALTECEALSLSTTTTATT